MLPAKGQKTAGINLKLFERVPRQIFGDEARSKPIKTRGYRGVSCEEVAYPSRGKRNLEWLLVVGHKRSCALQNYKCRMAFIEMADFRMNPQRREYAPAANAEHELLRKT